MPDVRELLDEGIRHQAGGALERAAAAYASAADVRRPGVDPALIAEALRRSADIQRLLCDWDASIQLAHRSEAVAERIERTDLLAEALHARADVHLCLGQLDAARELFQRTLTLTDSRRTRAEARQGLGAVATLSRDFDTAEEHFVQAFRDFDLLGCTAGMAQALSNYGRAALDRGADAVAHPVLVRAEAIARELMNLELHARVRVNLGESFLRRAELERAQQLASAALGYHGNTRNDHCRIPCLRLLGDIALAQRRTESACALYDAALRLARRLGSATEIPPLEQRLAAIGPIPDPSSDARPAE